MPSGSMVVATSINCDSDARLARAYAALFQPSKAARRVSRSTLEVGLRCSNLAVWIYACVQFAHSVS